MLQGKLYIHKATSKQSKWVWHNMPFRPSFCLLMLDMTGLKKKKVKKKRKIKSILQFKRMRPTVRELEVAVIPESRQLLVVLKEKKL